MAFDRHVVLDTVRYAAPHPLVRSRCRSWKGKVVIWHEGIEIAATGARASVMCA